MAVFVLIYRLREFPLSAVAYCELSCELLNAISELGFAGGGFI